MDNRGTLYLCGISDLKKYSNTNRKYFIARYVKNPETISTYGFMQLPDLSPPKALVNQYLEYKSAGRWDSEMFESWYVPEFKHLMKTEPSMRSALNYIWKQLKQGDVTLACYCHDKDMCHRTIVGKAYEELGITVVYA